MKKIVFIVMVVFLTGFVFASTLGSSFQDPSTLEAEIKPVRSVLVKLPKIVKRPSEFLTIKSTHYGPPDFNEGDPTFLGKPVSLGQVAVSQDPNKRVLPLDSTFRVLGIKEFQGIIFEITDTGNFANESQIDFFLRPDQDKKLIEALGDQPISIQVISKGSP